MLAWLTEDPAQRWAAYLITFGVAGLLSTVLTPRLRDAALRFGIVDRPDGRLKNHGEPVPYLGGLAIYLAFLISLALTFDFSVEVLGLLLAGSIVVILGLVDDLGQLGPWTKLAGQLVGGKPIILYIIGQSFNILLTLFLAWLAFGGVIFQAF